MRPDLNCVFGKLLELPCELCPGGTRQPGLHRAYAFVGKRGILGGLWRVLELGWDPAPLLGVPGSWGSSVRRAGGVISGHVRVDD